MTANDRFWNFFFMAESPFGYKTGNAGAGYLIKVAPGMGCDEQNGLPVSMGTMQRQPVRQGLPTPQLPPQVAKPFASLRNCRAETVPAQRTPMTSAVKNIDLIFLFMSLPSLFQELNGWLPYFAGSAAITRHVPVVNPGCLTSPVRTLGQGKFLPRKSRWPCALKQAGATAQPSPVLSAIMD